MLYGNVGPTCVLMEHVMRKSVTVSVVTDRNTVVLVWGGGGRHRGRGTGTFNLFIY